MMALRVMSLYAATRRRHAVIAFMLFCCHTRLFHAARCPQRYHDVLLADFSAATCRYVADIAHYANIDCYHDNTVTR